MLGFSDAKLSVVKRGPEEVIAQGLLADYIGPKVCPHVTRFLADGYEMEVLQPPVFRDFTALTKVYDLLKREVWPRRPWTRFYAANLQGGWREALLLWSLNSGWITQAIHEVYPTEPADGYCLIHGDPALSNLMRRQDGWSIVLTDPMPRLPYRNEIPARREVDLGKLVQSAMGWERILGEPLEITMWQEVDTLLRFLPAQDAKPALLWGAIHLARVGWRARSRQNKRIESWAFGASRSLIEWMKEWRC